MKLAAAAIAISLLTPGPPPKRQQMHRCEGFQLTTFWSDGAWMVHQWKECKPSRERRRR